MSAISIQNAWSLAERRVFAEVIAKTKAVEGQTAFLGYVPVERPNLWAFTSGGGADNLEMLQGVGAPLCFGTLWTQARFIFLYGKREDAQNKAMEVMGIFRDTENFNRLGNVQSCRVLGMPSEPILVEFENGLVTWMVEIPCQLLFCGYETFN